MALDLRAYCTNYSLPFPYVSSAATYVGLEAGLIDDQSLQALYRLRLLNDYRWSKHTTDRILMKRVAKGKSTTVQ
jgi:ADP-L-glycero-D-manno-heptose 6-epimerase